ncbi:MULTISPECIES: D-glycero-beta-D-manno-heptose-7-phosphate kinase [unclassified Haematospirillum]|uniref:D-glycero-beta-D-manno-heptose-7-phosphate kinase n=1 Tax=unclassified Haematospirillum TaxID=2622088 RepID=UPI001439DD57|nr:MULTISPECIES: D-glycero-beta-D-manno-heptose-7-phosphate kinase [unclassified Haematospirillum]NKD55648.1 D-glycero-beta-D-manno-heptose-7-phosphate kinase [Haematospirillum sp. H4890]NKD75173.1 D-glycero-beta-D-manno-heptose-7-phosphate kinase [Haematospirillum sp. H4485]
MSTQNARLAARVADLANATVLCIGDIMLDHFIAGAVDRISPEAPIPVLRVTGETVMLGGAGNVVRNLSGLGARTCFISALGDDAPGRNITSQLTALHGVDSSLHVEDGRTTGVKIRYSAVGQQLLRVDRETVHPVGESCAHTLVDRCLAALPNCGSVVLSDYGKGVLIETVIRPILEKAATLGIPVVVDPKGRDYTIYHGAAVVTPNRRELADATGMPTRTDNDIVAAARFLAGHCSIPHVLATRSEDGMTLVDANGSVLHLPAQTREVYDVSGAGDTVVATVAAALACGLSLPDAAALANVAAGIVVGKSGTAAVTAAELVDALHHRDIGHAEARILDLPRIADLVRGWKQAGLKVGFTNGCFDLLHPGHLSLLRQARTRCDRLVVGMNSDDSVKRLKGEGRPIQAESARAAVLATLELVDAVVIFDEDTPLKIIEALLPDVLVKGADYTIETVVGSKVVLGAGGEVFLATLEPGQSTTRTVNRLREKA